MFISQRFFLFSCAVLLALSFLELPDCPVLKPSAQETAFLVIGVLSAQNNSAARSSIRHTWKTLLKGKNVKFFFIIGRETCLIPLIDRKSELSCEPLDISHQFALKPLLWTPNVGVNSQESSEGVAMSFTFHVNFPIVLRSIRVRRQVISKLDSAVVNVKNARTGKLIISSKFQSSDKLLENSNTWIEAQETLILLPKSFDAEVQIVVETYQGQGGSDRVPLLCYEKSLWFNLSGAIEYTSQFAQDKGWVTFDKNFCSPVSILLELHELQSHLLGKDTRRTHWLKEVAILSKSMRTEAEREKDIIFVDIVDVYRNIPVKLLKFYEWVHNRVNFSFLLKADDDTFLDMLAIHKYLESLILVEKLVLGQMWWWGKFRHGLPVERHGKWQELQYAAPIYPPFPCGGGYIINKNIVEFLVNNGRWLHPFQGEDTSLGIWLSGIHPMAPKNASCNWICGLECHKLACNRGQLTPDDMFSVWHRYRKGHSLC